jgi:hypothetical protein
VVKLVISLQTAPTYNKEAQSLRSLTGRSFEKNVAKTITDILSREGIYARSFRDLKNAVKYEPGLAQVIEYAHMMVNSPCLNRYELILPDTDIVAYYVEKGLYDNEIKRYHLATISCKVSFRERYAESAFWASALRGHQKRFVLVTEDKADELESCEKGLKARRVLESYIDGGIYLMKSYGKNTSLLDSDTEKFFEIFKKSQRSAYARAGTTLLDSGRRSDRYCDKVRPFDDLVFDLMAWKFERQRRGIRT